MVQQAEVELHDALSDHLATAGPLSLGIAHRELLWNGAPVSSGPARRGSGARELAERLHRRGVGALTFQPGVTVEALRDALGWIAHEAASGKLAASSRTAPAAGAPSEHPPTLTGVAIGRMAYDRLVLGNGETSDQLEAGAIWRALASAAFDLELLETASGALAEQEQVQLRREQSDGRATGAQAGNGGSSEHDGEGTSDSEGDSASEDLLANASPDDIAAAIELRAQQAPYARRVAQVLLTLATQVGNAPPAVREELGQRLRAVLRKLGDSSLASVLRSAGTGREQRQLLSEVISALPVQAVVEWLEVAARATNHELSHQLMRILDKLSRHATDRRGRERQEVALRSAARDLVSSWRLSDPNPVAHSSLLDHIALFDVTTLPSGAARTIERAGVSRDSVGRDTVNGEAVNGVTAMDDRPVEPHETSAPATVQPPVDGLATELGTDDTDVEITAEHAIHDLAASSVAEDVNADESIPGEGGRLVKMACEIGIASHDAIGAAQQLVADGYAARLFAWLDASPNEQTGSALREGAIATRAVVAALQLEPFDAVAVRALVSALPVEAASVLLDALEQANSRSARRVLYDRLREFGPSLVPHLIDRLQGTPPWYFARNLLALLRDASTSTPGASTPTREAGATGEVARPSDLRQFLHHPAEQVRIEAVRILLDDEATRELAMRHALEDVNDRIVRAGVDAVLAFSDASASGARGTISSVIAARLMHLADESKYDADLRARAVRALSGSPGPTVRDWLLGHVSRRTLVLRRLSLAESSPVVIAALGVLAARHARDPRVTPLLAQASRTRDARRTAVVESSIVEPTGLGAHP